MILERFGAPLRHGSRPEPAIRPDEVLVRVGACGVCGTDLKISSGALRGIGLPRIMGHEIAGTVERVGDEVQGLRPGTRVSCYFYVSCGHCRNCRAGRGTICTDFKGRLGFERDGGFAEYVAVPAENCIPIPDSLGYAEAGVLEDAVSTPDHAIVTRGALRAGETALILGVGGLGLHAVQVARAAGARVIAVDIDAGRLQRARELGAGETIAMDEETFRSRVLEATGGEGVDLVFETVARAETLRAAASVLSPGGRLVPVGYYPGRDLALDTEDIVLREISVLPSRAAGLNEVMRTVHLVSSGAVQVQISERLPLRNLNEALGALRGGELSGRAVIDFSIS